MNTGNIRLEEAIGETQFGPIIFGGLNKVTMGIYHASHPIERNIALVSGSCLASGGGLTLGANELHLGDPVVGKLEAAVHAGYAVISVREFPIG